VFTGEAGVGHKSREILRDFTRFYELLLCASPLPLRRALESGAQIFHFNSETSQRRRDSALYFGSASIKNNKLELCRSSFAISFSRECAARLMRYRALGLKKLWKRGQYLQRRGALRMGVGYGKEGGERRRRRRRKSKERGIFPIRNVIYVSTRARKPRSVITR
jgi:hypothetical protein